MPLLNQYLMVTRATHLRAVGAPLAHPLVFARYRETKDAMIGAGIPEQIAEMNAQAFRLTADGDAEWVTPDIPSLLGRPARSFEQFTADYAAAFS